jgi:hypothetical protein
VFPPVLASLLLLASPNVPVDSCAVPPFRCHVLTAVDVLGVRVVACFSDVAAIHTDVLSATGVSNVSGVPAVVGIHALL